jgi:hypothetical protein
MHVNMHCRAVDVKIADWVAFEFLPFRFIALHVWQTRNAVPLQTAMQ